MRPDGDRARTSIADQIGALSDADLVNEFGPRVWWDEIRIPDDRRVRPVGVVARGPRQTQEGPRRAFALKQASSDAKSHLATFINASTRFGEVSDQAKRPRNSASSIGGRHGERRG